MNRITDTARRYATRIQSRHEIGTSLQGEPISESLVKLDNEMSITASEHFAFQDAQARAHAGGVLSLDEAQTIYVALGNVQSTTNGGWQPHVDLPLKLTITQTMGELL